mmetsp:Transcript_43854/g.113245  ORF Transcript_43854/g.113245 Transcript_43854/m.113245 type:complete len:134 (-) Transcript_43854:101-502(-)
MPSCADGLLRWTCWEELPQPASSRQERRVPRKRDLSRVNTQVEFRKHVQALHKVPVINHMVRLNHPLLARIISSQRRFYRMMRLAAMIFVVCIFFRWRYFASLRAFLSFCLWYASLVFVSACTLAVTVWKLNI